MTAPVLSDVSIEDKLNAIRARKAQIEAARATRAEAAKLPPSPEEILRAEEEAVARMEREEADEKAWRDALVKHGRGRCGRIRCAEGAIVMRVMTPQESDDFGHRIAAATTPEMKTAIGREATLDVVEYPSRERTREMCTARPLLWLKLYEMRDALASGEEEALAGKA